MASPDEAPQAQPLFVQYTGFRADPAWRRLPYAAREDGREAFARAIEETAPEIKTYPYSTVGLKTNCDLLLWRKGTSPISMQDFTGRLLQTGIGQYLEITHNLYGFTRPSSYTKRPTTQEQAIDLEDRQTYLVVYPFSKTTEWFLMSREARQGMMNEHMRIGHDFADIRQVLLYATGLDDQEFIVAYETEDLPRFSALVTDLRATDARRYTLKDTPILTGIKRPLREALSLIG
ncbi:MAG TPA: chlorite dismutase family protein [Roseiflexaceae bacterium]|nr:chlorite dismutase family protein [Roseiflexaceae bacterium]